MKSGAQQFSSRQYLVAHHVTSDPKADGSRRSEYGKYLEKDGKEIGFEHVIRYDEGITADHVMASGSFPPLGNKKSPQIMMVL